MGLLELDVTVAVQGHLAPDGALHGNVRQGLQERLLRFGKERQGFLPGGAVDAIPRRLQDPPPQLGIGVGQGAKLPEGDKAPLDVLDVRFHLPLLLGFSRRTGGDDEAVSLGQLPVGALDRRIPETGPDDGALGVVDDHPGGDTAEKLEGPPVTAQPGIHPLIRNHLGIHVAAEALGHDEDPALDPLAGEGVDDVGTPAEVHLDRLSRLIIQDAGRLHPAFPEPMDQTAHGRVASREAVLVDQGLMDDGAADAFLDPLADLLFVRQAQGLLGGVCDRGALDGGRQNGVVRKRPFPEPALCLRGSPNLGALRSAHQSGLGDDPVTLPHAHAVNHLTVMVHLEPPVAHDRPSRRLICRESIERNSSVRDLLKTLHATVRPQRSIRGGSIAPITKWLYCGDHQLAPLRRLQSGLITPITKWLYSSDN